VNFQVKLLRLFSHQTCRLPGCQTLTDCQVVKVKSFKFKTPKSSHFVNPQVITFKDFQGIPKDSQVTILTLKSP